MGRVITDSASIRAIAKGAKRVAVLGIKTEQQADQPAFYVPAYLHQSGVEVIPVPVYYPAVKEILGATVYRRVQDVPGVVDILDVFRRPSDLHAHLDDVIAKKPNVVWLQTGIEDDEFARALAQAGIDVVQDRCLMVEHRHAR